MQNETIVLEDEFGVPAFVTRENAAAVAAAGTAEGTAVQSATQWLGTVA